MVAILLEVTKIGINGRPGYNNDNRNTFTSFLHHFTEAIAMQNFLLAAIISGIVLSSCGGEHKTDIFLARSYFDSIKHELAIGKKIQQKLIDESTSVLLSIKADTAFTVDIQSFQALVDSAKIANGATQQNIEKITEIDPQINYKAKVLEYLKLFESFYENEYKEFVVVVNQKREDRFEKATRLMLSKLKTIKEHETGLENAKADFNNKYPVDPDGVAKTEPDFEYVKLKDFKYTQANINPGEEISLLSYSGGKDCSDKTIYYEQFIGVVKSTGDTVRILTPCQVYDREKAYRIAYFQGDVTAGALNLLPGEALVVFNKNQPFLEKMDLKTTIGTLSFKE